MNNNKVKYDSGETVSYEGSCNNTYNSDQCEGDPDNKNSVVGDTTGCDRRRQLDPTARLLGQDQSFYRDVVAGEYI
jgi:hypothetical protein